MTHNTCYLKCENAYFPIHWIKSVVSIQCDCNEFPLFYRLYEYWRSKSLEYGNVWEYY